MVNLNEPHVYIDGVAVNVNVAKEAHDLLDALDAIKKLTGNGCFWPSDFDSICIIVNNALRKAS